VRTVFLSLLLFGLGLAAGCGGGTASNSQSITPPGGSGNGSNVLAIAVNGGPTAHLANGSIYQNAAFASVKICAPGSSSDCVTINNLLVDTGSPGLRIFQSEVSSLNLPAANAANGSGAWNCVSFVDGSYMWGQVEKADLTLGGETASGVPIQVISSTTNNVPSTCSNGSTRNENSVALLGANGILGVGIEPTDCFYSGASVCDASSGLSNPPSPAYYTCSGSTCTPAFVSTSNQVANPVAHFAKDNNGVIVDLPAASGATMTGSLIFGIGTESNNQLASSATVFTLACDNFTTNFDGQTFGITNAVTCAGPGSFIDSGSNALYFPNVPNMTECSSNTSVGDLTGFYCPATTRSFTATNVGNNGVSKPASFRVANTEALLTNSATAFNAVQPTLGGLNPAGFGFDWGLPFFYGVRVYNAIDGKSVPSGTPAAPWWAY
jgi:hypothetical protein